MEALLRDQEVCGACVANRVERRAAHQSMVALVTMLEATVGPNLLSRPRLPATLHVMRLLWGQTRRRGSRGFVIDRADDTVDVVPPDWTAEEVLIVHHNIDRCGIGGSAVAFGQCSLLLLWAVTWGRLRDSWKIIKTVAKGEGISKFWQGLVKFSGVTILPLGHFSGRRHVHRKCRI